MGIQLDLGGYRNEMAEGIKVNISMNTGMFEQTLSVPASS